jgi:hypothetical protein
MMVSELTGQIEWLREVARWGRPKNDAALVADTLEKQAAEIERLEARVRVKDARLVTARQEIERLEAAVREWQRNGFSSSYGDKIINAMQALKENDDE